VLVPTFRLPTLIHSRSGNAKWLVEISNRNPLWMHPEDANKWGFKTGDLVKMNTDIGYFVDKVWVTQSMKPGVVACSHHIGRWRREQDKTGNRWATNTVNIENKTKGEWKMSTKSGIKPFDSGDKDSKKLLDLYKKIQLIFDQGNLASSIEFTVDELIMIRPLCLITIKPIMFVANVDENGFKDNSSLDELSSYANKLNIPVVTVCAKLESDIADLEDEEKEIFLTELGLEEPGLNRLIRASYKLLGLQTYFTAGIKEVRAWTIPVGSTAPQAAGVIHTDFEKGFIRAETISYSDYVSFGSEAKVKEAGKMRVEGKEYIVKDGDVMHFRFNV